MIQNGRKIFQVKGWLNIMWLYFILSWTECLTEGILLSLYLTVCSPVTGSTELLFRVICVNVLRFCKRSWSSNRNTADLWSVDLCVELNPTSCLLWWTTTEQNRRPLFHILQEKTARLPKVSVKGHQSKFKLNSSYLVICVFCIWELLLLLLNCECISHIIIHNLL